MQASPLAAITPEMWATLSVEERRQLHEGLHRLVGGRSLSRAIEDAFPDEPPPRHVQPIIDLLEYARVKPIRAVLDMGPGHAKTVTLARGIANWLHPDNSPGDLCAYVTYSGQEALSKSRIVQDALIKMGGQIDPSKTADGDWLTPWGGGLTARGSRGGLTGRRVPGLLIYDDPYKDMQEARSPAVNSMIIERFKGVAVTRLQGGSIIVLHTRWHINDLIGYILKELKWDHVHVPTVCDRIPDFLGRKLGEAAWPEKYPNIWPCEGICSHDGHLKEIEETLGPHMFAAMYQGQPRPEGQAMFHEPARFGRGEFTWTNKRGVIALDPAATAKTSSDYSVALICAIEGYGAQSRMWILDRVRVQVEIPELLKIVVALQYKYRLMVAVEAVGGFKAVPQMLRSIDRKLRVVELEAAKDKFTRALGYSAAWNDGRVLVPVDAPWADEFVAEHSVFTGSNDAHDDQVDAGAHAWNVLYRTQPKIVDSDYEAAGV